LKSAGDLDKAEGKSDVHGSEQNLVFSTVALNQHIKLNTVDERSIFPPIRLVEEQLRQSSL
jgi:hypothetical protein